MRPLRSPLFYVGDKWKLMPQLESLFPSDISVYVEPFVGGGSSFLNTPAERCLLNDLDPWIIKIHEELLRFSKNEEGLLRKLYAEISRYGFSCSYKGILAPEDLKRQYPKTYYAHFNKEPYARLRAVFNHSNKDNLLDLYLLIIYGFNHMIRFNSKGDFNLPVGNVDFNCNVQAALHGYLQSCKGRDLYFSASDFREFLERVDLKDKRAYVYCDPPYMISSSEYNKFWSQKDEEDLYETLDELNVRGVRFGMTNLVHHKGKTNDILLEWSKKYVVFPISSNYISFNDNSVKMGSQEVFVTNYVR